jgi:hypothetical protein
MTTGRINQVAILKPERQRQTGPALNEAFIADEEAVLQQLQRVTAAIAGKVVVPLVMLPTVLFS